MGNRISPMPDRERNLPISCNLFRRLTAVLSLLALISGMAPAAVETAAKDIEQIRELKVDLTPEERQWLETHPVIELGIDPGFAPFEFIDENGTYRGIAADYVELIQPMLGVTMRVSAGLPWREVVEKARKHEIDILPCVGRNREREGYLLFTNPYLSFPRVVFTRKSGMGPASQEDLARFTVGVQEGSSHHGWIKENTNILPILYPTAQDAMLALSNGEIQAAVGNLAASSYIIKHLNLGNLKVAFPLSGGPQELAFGVRNDWPEMVSILNKTLAAVPLTKATAIRRSWVDPENEKSLEGQLQYTSEEKAWLQAHPEITIGVMNAWPPLNFVDIDGKPAGIGVDILELLVKRAGLNVKIIPGQFEDNLDDVRNRQTDALMDVTPNQEREAYLNFTSPYLVIPHVIIARKGETFFETEDRLTGQTLALERGFGNNKYFGDHYPGVNVVNYESTDECLSAVAKGRADAYAGNLVVAIYIISQKLLTNLEVQSNLQKEGSVLAIGTRKDWPELASILNKALASLAPEEKRAVLIRWTGDYDARKEGAGPVRLSLPRPVVFNQTNFLLRNIAVVFALLAVVVFIVWFLKGRPKQLTIRETLFLVSFIFTGLIIAIGVFARTLLKAQADLSRIETRKYGSLNLAFELKQSSDDLARFARTFVLTGDPRYEQYFHTIMAIREGKRAHPGSSSLAFWDLVTGGVATVDEKGETYRIESKMLELGISGEERKRLEEAIKESDALTGVETMAINAAKGLYKDSEGRFTVKGEPVTKMARDLLYGEAYHKARSRIMKSIDEFFTLLEWRTANELNLVRGRFQAVISSVTVLTVITIVFSIYVFFLLKRRIIQPLSQLEDGARTIRGGNYAHHIEITSRDEVGTLAQAFNSMTNSIEEHTADLKEAREHFQQLLEAAPDGFVVVDESGLIVLANAQAEKLFGYEKEKMIGRPIEMLLPDDLKAKHAGMKAHYFQNPRHLSSELRPDLEALHSDGTLIPVEISLSPIKTNRGVLVVASIRDITERKKAERALAEAKEAAEAATKAKSDFLANMSHEIRTPMSAIIGMSHLALKTDLTRKQYDYISKVQLSANTLLGIINDILDFSKIEAGKLDMECARFQLEDVLGNLGTLVGIRAEEKGLELLINLDKDVPTGLVGDPLRLGQILTNLCNNAVKFTEKGEIVVSISTVERSGETAKLRFSVKDSGIGLTEDQKRKLFQPFSQADTSTTRKYGGTGLGLTISKKLCEMMGGEIWVESVFGEGSIFIFTALFGLHAAKARALLPEPDLRGKPVLVVDDSQTFRDILRNMLESMSFVVSESASGEGAVNDIVQADQEGRPFEVVYMDWRMPGMNGMAAAGKIKTLGLSLQPRIIMVTAYGREEIMRQAENLKLDGFLVKPVSRSLLFDATMEAFGREGHGGHDATIDKSKEYKALKDIRGARILLAEDNEINQQVAREILEQAGLVVEIAHTGKEAVKMAQENRYDAILMDIQMPEMSGIEATRAIRSLDSETREIPVIAMTAHAMAGDREKSIGAGMNDHVTKPIVPEDLFGSLIKWIKPGKREPPGDLPGKTSGEEKPAGKRPLPQIRDVDMKSGLSTAGGNEKLYRSLLVKFYKEYPDTTKKIKEALAREDLELGTRLAHTVKGVAANLGAKSLKAAGADVEGAIRNGDLENIGGLLDIFEGQIQSVMRGLRDFVEAEEDREEERGERETGDPAELKECLGKLQAFIDRKKPRQCQEILAGISRYSWPEKLKVEIVQLREFVSKYKFKEALPVIESLLEQLRKA